MSKVQTCREIGRHTYPARPKRGTSVTCERCGTIRTCDDQGRVSYTFPDLAPEPGFIEPARLRDWEVGVLLTIRAASAQEAEAAAEEMLPTLSHDDLKTWQVIVRAPEGWRAG